MNRRWITNWWPVHAVLSGYCPVTCIIPGYANRTESTVCTGILLPNTANFCKSSSATFSLRPCHVHVVRCGAGVDRHHPMWWAGAALLLVHVCGRLLATIYTKIPSTAPPLHVFRHDNTSHVETLGVHLYCCTNIVLALFIFVFSMMRTDRAMVRLCGQGKKMLLCWLVAALLKSLFFELLLVPFRCCPVIQNSI
jgi:hypothetical protein